MYFTRFGYFVIVSVIVVAIAAVFFVVWPFDDSGGNGGDTLAPTATAAGPSASPTPDPIPELSFQQVINFATYGAVVSIEVTGSRITVNLNPAFDVSGLNATSHTFRTTLPQGSNSVEEALQAGGVEVNGDTGVPVIRR